MDLCYTADVPSDASSDATEAVHYTEVDANWSASFSNVRNTQNGAKRTLRCKWEDSSLLIDFLLTENTTVVGALDVVIGSRHPLYLGMYVVGVEIKPFGNPVAESTWEFAELDVTYATLPFDIGSPEILREDGISYVTSLIPISKDSLLLDSEPGSRDAQVMMTYLRYCVTLKGIKTVPASAIATCLNKLNSGSFTLRLGKGNTATIAANKVLYLGPSDIRIAYIGSTSNTSQRFDITHTFLISPYDQNTEYDATATDALLKDRLVTCVPQKYETASFTGLGV